MDNITKLIGRTPIHNPPLTETHKCEEHGEYTATCRIAARWSPCPECDALRVAKQEEDEKAKQHAAALAAWLGRIDGAGIPPRFQDRRFKNYVADTPEKAGVLEISKNYAADWPEVSKSGRCLVFLGAPGTGKTHLACAIGAHVMHKHHATVIFRTVYQAMRSVRDTWVKGSSRAESEAIAELISPDLLILDEVGIQSGSDWEKTILFDVLNERYQKRRPTILLSNLVDEELPAYLGERVIDRLREDGGEVVAFGWESWRARENRK